MPDKISWKTQERHLNITVGDVVNVQTDHQQNFDGTPKTTKVQVTRINTVYGVYGRYYNVQSLSYLGEVVQDTVIGGGCEINLFIAAGAPPDAGEYTFILDGGQYCSTDIAVTSIVAGGFAVGTKLIIILINGADWQGKGGAGGDGQVIQYIQSQNAWLEVSPSTPGETGGNCYDAQGIDTDIYLGGTAPGGQAASGFLRAPGGGGDGGTGGNFFGEAGSGGGGGAGINPGLGGAGGEAFGVGGIDGSDGFDGDTNCLGGDGGFNGIQGGAGGDCGLPGVTGAPAGKGIVKSGATVQVFGDTPANFTNGNGDSPD